MRRRTSLTLSLVGLVALVASCATTPFDRTRFANQAPIWLVDDRGDVPDKPEERLFLRNAYGATYLLARPVTHAMDLPTPRRARNTNALDEVPDSTWFTNRIGRRDLSPQVLLRGPNRGDGPDRSAPWTVLGTKVGGLSPGFMIRDARGDRFLLKFDEAGEPETETGADVVVQRLLWAVGYHVPEDEIVLFRREDLVLAPNAKEKTITGTKKPLTIARFDEIMAMIDRRPDGSYRGLTSKFLPGAPIGGYPQEGVRSDDPNDVVPHEDRRDLRGQYVFFAWLSHTDLKEDNWLDMWVEDEDRPGAHHVRHYLLDFGKALGTLHYLQPAEEDGYAYNFDWAFAIPSVFTFGLWRRPWEGIEYPRMLGLADFEAESFDPASWKPKIPVMAFWRRDKTDDFWAAKILMRLRRPHIEAAVQAGKYSDPRTAEYLVEVLLARQEKLGRWAFSRLSPLDRFTVEAADAGAIRVCFEDLWTTYRFGDGRSTRYRLQSRDFEGAPLGPEARVDTPEASVCSVPLPRGRAHDGYTILEVSVARDEEEPLPPVHVHVADGPDGAPRIIGIRRQ